MKKTLLPLALVGIVSVTLPEWTMNGAVLEGIRVGAEDVLRWNR